MAQHTPGKWTQGSMHGDRMHMIFANGYAVATCGPDYRRLPHDGEEKQILANARLIAAAPDTTDALEELKNCAALIDNKHHAHTPITNEDWSDLHAAINKARAAIARARGEG